MYEFHYDSGHGWLKVSKQELINLSIENKISTFSYMHGDDVYLEEDCDAGVFQQAMDRADKEFETTAINDGDDSIIRTYDNYKAR